MNCDQVGYYRVNYPDSDWAAFADALVQDHTAMTVSDRANLINAAMRLKMISFKLV